jgi:hypothetical protein
MARSRIPWLKVVPLAALAALVGAYATRPGELPPGTDRAALAAPESGPFESVGLPARDGVFAAFVCDEAGQPVASAVVSVLVGDEVRGELSDDAGRVAMRGLPRGARQVKVVAMGRDPLQVELADDPAEARLVLGAVAPTPTFAGTLRGRCLVTIAAPATLDLRGMELWLEPVAAAHRIDAPLPARASIAAEGALRFEALWPGAYELRLLPEWAAGGTWPVLSAPKQVAIGAEEAVVALELAAARAEVSVLDLAGRPVSGALVVLRTTGDAPRPAPGFATGADGKGRSAWLPRGKWSVSVQAGAAKGLAEVELGEAELASVVVTLDA